MLVQDNKHRKHFYGKEVFSHPEGCMIWEIKRIPLREDVFQSAQQRLAKTRSDSYENKSSLIGKSLVSHTLSFASNCLIEYSSLFCAGNYNRDKSNFYDLYKCSKAIFLYKMCIRKCVLTYLNPYSMGITLLKLSYTV